MTSIFKIYFLDAQASLLSSTYAGTSVRWLVGHTFFFRISILSASLSPHKSSRRHCGGRHGGGHGDREGGRPGGQQKRRRKNGRHGVGYGGMADMVVDKLADIEVDMVADMEMRWTWTLTRTWTSTWKTFIAYLQRHEISQILILKDRKSLHQATFIQPDTSDKNIIIIITTKDFPTKKTTARTSSIPQFVKKARLI